MAASIAAPLERRLGEIPGVTEITSTSSHRQHVDRHPVRHRRATSRARPATCRRRSTPPTTDLPSDLPTRPYYRKFNPAEAPILTLSLTSDVIGTAQVYDAADTILAQRLSQVEGVANVRSTARRSPPCGCG